MLRACAPRWPNRDCAAAVRARSAARSAGSPLRRCGADNRHSVVPGRVHFPRFAVHCSGGKGRQQAGLKIALIACFPFNK